MAAKDQDSNSPRSPAGWWLLVAICAVFLAQIVYGIVVFMVFRRMDVRGQFGDIFGGINALFTGLAFAGVIYTILLQRRELELQRTELRLNRDELSRSAQAQTEQVLRMKEAADLNAMTSLLNVYGTVLEPFWNSTSALRTEIGRLNTPPMSSDDFSMATMLEDELRNSRREWSSTLHKHEKLVSKLEQMVEQSSRIDSNNEG